MKSLILNFLKRGYLIFIFTLICNSQNIYHQNVFKSAKKEFESYKKSNDVNHLETAFINIEIIRTSEDNELSNYEIYDYNDIFLVGEIYYEVFESLKKGILKPTYNREYLAFREIGSKSFLTFEKLFNDFPKQTSLRKKIIEYFIKLEISLSEIFVSEKYISDGHLNTASALVKLQEIFSKINHENFDISKWEKYMFWYAKITFDQVSSIEKFKKNAPKEELKVYKEAAFEIYKELYKRNYKEIIIYTQLFNLTKDTDEKQAFEYLEKGKQLFPDNSDLFVVEMRHYYSRKEFDTLIEKLLEFDFKYQNNIDEKIATVITIFNIANEFDYESPDYLKYEKKAIQYSDLILQKKKKEDDIYYSLGAHYFNIGANLTVKLNDETDDKQKSIEQKIKSLFNKAKVYFIKSEKIDANKVDTLFALKEIFKYEKNIKLEDEFKKRLENIKNGLVNKSYFLVNDY